MQQCGWGSCNCWSRPYLRLRAKDDRSSRGLSAAGDRFPPPRRRVLGGLAPDSGKGGEEACHRTGEEHWEARGGGSCPPLGTTWCAPTARERCTVGEPTTVCQHLQTQPLMASFKLYMIIFKILIWYQFQLHCL